MYLVDYYASPQAGTEGQLLQLIQHLDRSRYEPAITVLRNSEYIKRNPFPCPVRVLGITRLASMAAIFKVLRYALSLRRENYCLVHCFLNDSSLIGPPLLRLFGIRMVVSRRDLGFWYTPWNLAVLRIAALFVDRYVANSQAVKGVVQQREWVPGEKISVIYNGCAARLEQGEQVADLTKRYGIPDSAPLIGIVANLRPIKRIDTLLAAFALIGNRFPKARLMIIGDDGPSQQGRSMRGELESLAGQLGVSRRVIFTGRLDDPAPLINQFTVAVLCSESEGFSNSIIEYMQAGRPIVCTDIGGNPELIQDGYNGFLVPVRDANALADRLLRLLSDRNLACRLGETARDAVLNHYTPTRMVTEQMACYDKILQSA